MFDIEEQIKALHLVNDKQTLRLQLVVVMTVNIMELIPYSLFVVAFRNRTIDLFSSPAYFNL